MARGVKKRNHLYRKIFKGTRKSFKTWSWFKSRKGRIKNCL